MSKSILFVLALAVAFLLMNSCQRQTEFSQTYGTGIDETGSGMVVTNDGGFALIRNNPSSYDLIKTDAKGIVQWSQNYPLGSKGRHSMRDIIQTSDGGYAVIGQTSLMPFSEGHYSVGYVMKLSSNGNIQWTQSLAGLKYAENFGNSIIQNSAGEYICSATIQFHPDYNNINYMPCIIKLSSNGSIIWSHAIENTNGSVFSIKSITGNQYIVSGNGNASYGGGIGSDILLAKYDDNGNKIWSRYYNYAPNVGNPNESGESCKILGNGDIIIIGYSSVRDANTSLVIKTNSLGIEQWHTISSSGPEYYSDGLITSNGSLWVTGQSENNFIIRLLDLSNGKVVNNYVNNSGAGTNIRECENGDIAAYGSTNAVGAGRNDAFLTRVSINKVSSKDKLSKPIPNTETFYQKVLEEEEIIDPNNDPNLIPQPIEYDGYPGAEYRIDGNIIALDEYIETDPSGFYLRMQFKGEKIVLNHLQSESDSLTDVFSNESYKVTFATEKYGECADEGSQEIFGKVTIKFHDKVNVLDFKSATSRCQDPKCKEIGNGM